MDCNPGPSKRVKYGDKNYDQILTQWADEIESDASDIDSDSDFIPSAHESESEIEAEEVDQGNHEEDDVGETSTSTAFYGKIDLNGHRFLQFLNTHVPCNTISSSNVQVSKI